MKVQLHTLTPTPSGVEEYWDLTWEGELTRFLIDNQFDGLSVCAICTALESGEPYYFGGGASPMCRVTRELSWKNELAREALRKAEQRAEHYEVEWGKCASHCSVIATERDNWKERAERAEAALRWYESTVSEIARDNGLSMAPAVAKHALERDAGRIARNALVGGNSDD